MSITVMVGTVKLFDAKAYWYTFPCDGQELTIDFMLMTEMVNRLILRPLCNECIAPCGETYFKQTAW